MCVCVRARAIIDVISANATEKATETQPLRLADAPTDPDVSFGGLHFGPEQLRVSVHGAQRRPQSHRPGAAAETSRTTASRDQERGPIRGDEVPRAGRRGEARVERRTGCHHLHLREPADQDAESTAKVTQARVRELRAGEQPLRGQVAVQRDRLVRPGADVRVERVPHAQVFPGEPSGRQAGRRRRAPDAGGPRGNRQTPETSTNDAAHQPHPLRSATDA